MRKKNIKKIAKFGAILSSAWASTFATARATTYVVTRYIAKVPTISTYRENSEVVSHQLVIFNDKITP